MNLVRIRLEYVVTWPNHAGLFVARKKGLYADQDLDVDISWDGFDRGTPAELTARGEFQFASTAWASCSKPGRLITPLLRSPHSTRTSLAASLR